MSDFEIARARAKAKRADRMHSEYRFRALQFGDVGAAAWAAVWLQRFRKWARKAGIK